MTRPVWKGHRKNRSGGGGAEQGAAGSPDVGRRQILKNVNIEKAATTRRQPKKPGCKEREGQGSRKSGH